MAASIITPEDLENLKKDLLQEIKKVLQENQAGPIKKWLKSSELRKILPVSAGTLYNLRVNGTLPFTRIGGVIFYDREDVEKLATSGKHQSLQLPGKTN